MTVEYPQLPQRMQPRATLPLTQPFRSSLCPWQAPSAGNEILLVLGNHDHRDITCSASRHLLVASDLPRADQDKPAEAPRSGIVDRAWGWTPVVPVSNHRKM
jgi:hypothetical protein